MIQESFFSKESVQGLGPLNQPIYGIEEILENEKTRKPANLYPKDFDLQKDNLLICGDNAEVMQRLLEMNGGKPFIDLIYIDPPFCSNRNYESTSKAEQFTDIWENGLKSYLPWLSERLRAIHSAMKDDASFFIHLDWHASHYVKQELDKIFGVDNFINEIIWHYEKWTAQSKSFQKNHDILLFYSKSKVRTFNILKSITENLKAKYEKGYLIGGGHGSKGLVVYDRNNPKVKELISSGKYKVVYSEMEGKPLSDVWKIPFINPVAKERLGYPTQKPESLVSRIVEAASQPGQLVADLFSGSGTTCAVAQKLGRRWIGVDQNPQAIEVAANRIKKLDSKFKIVEQR